MSRKSKKSGEAQTTYCCSFCRRLRPMFKELSDGKRSESERQCNRIPEQITLRTDVLIADRWRSRTGRLAGRTTTFGPGGSSTRREREPNKVSCKCHDKDRQRKQRSKKFIAGLCTHELLPLCFVCHLVTFVLASSSTLALISSRTRRNTWSGWPFGSSIFQFACVPMKVEGQKSAVLTEHIEIIAS